MLLSLGLLTLTLLLLAFLILLGQSLLPLFLLEVKVEGSPLLKVITDAERAFESVHVALLGLGCLVLISQV